MTDQSVINDLLKREGGIRTDPVDSGGRTAYGISEKANPEAWKDGQVTEAEARQIYEAKYIKSPGFDRVADDRLRAQLIDYGVHSGPAVAISKLQAILGVPVDGILGPFTLLALNNYHGEDLNNQLAIARIMMIGRLVAKNPSQVKFLVGWLNRATGFIA